MNRKEYPLRFAGNKIEVYNKLKELCELENKTINKTVVEIVERYIKRKTKSQS